MCMYKSIHTYVDIDIDLEIYIYTHDLRMCKYVCKLEVEL